MSNWASSHLRVNLGVCIFLELKTWTEEGTMFACPQTEECSLHDRGFRVQEKQELTPFCPVTPTQRVSNACRAWSLPCYSLIAALLAPVNVLPYGRIAKPRDKLAWRSLVISAPGLKGNSANGWASAGAWRLGVKQESAFVIQFIFSQVDGC